MSKRNLFIKDEAAERIINEVDYDFSKLKQSKWLSMMMAARAGLIDEWCSEWINKHPEGVVVHGGCGLDSRCQRVDAASCTWIDLDFPEVIEIRKQFYKESERVKMIGSSIIETDWIRKVDKTKSVLIVMEGLTMYLNEQDIKKLLADLTDVFSDLTLIFDAYSKKAVKASKFKNPVNQMNASVVWGMDQPADLLKLNTSLSHVRTSAIKKQEENLTSSERFIFENLYCGKTAQSYYKIYEFKMNEE